MRKLSLTKETLVELTSEELDRVVGGAITVNGCTVPQSDFQRCITNGVCDTLLGCRG